MQGASAAPLSLRAAVVEALAFNPVVRSAGDDRHIADAQLQVAEAGYVPRLDVQYGLTREELDNRIRRLSGVNKDSYSHRETIATLSHTLYDFRNVSSQVDRAESRVRAAAYTVNSTATDIALETVGAFFELMRRQQTVALAQENLDAHRRIREMIRLRSAGGVSRPSDFDQAESRLSLAVAGLVQEQAALEAAQAAFLRVSGLRGIHLGMPTRPQLALPGIWGTTAWEMEGLTGADAAVDLSRQPDEESSLSRAEAPCHGWVAQIPVDRDGRPLDLAAGLSPQESTAEDVLRMDGYVPECPENQGQTPQERAAAAAARDYALQVALPLHPAVRASRAQVEAARFQVQVARSAYAPRLNLEVSASRSDDVVQDEIEELSAGIRARWNLFNGGADRAGVDQAGAELDRAQEQQRRVEQAVTEGLSQAGILLLSSRDRVVVLRRYAQAIASARTAYLKQFSIGQRSLLDLVNSQDETYSARSQLATAEVTARFAEYRVHAAMGQLLQALEIALPKAALVPE
ncbi:MAG: TolC family protein [Panacagrimonas sp.]